MVCMEEALHIPNATNLQFVKARSQKSGNFAIFQKKAPTGLNNATISGV